MRRPAIVGRHADLPAGGQLQRPRIKALTPTYTPEQAASTIADLIERPRREAIVGRSGQEASRARAACGTGLVDRIFARRAVRDQFDGDQPAEETAGNLFEPDERWATVSGGWCAEEAEPSNGGAPSA